MPVYEYLCGDCQKKFELFVPQRMNTEGVVCRQCHGANVRKLVSTFASVGAEGEASFGAAEMSGSGGGCCGGACGCGCSH
jgi:putative FmdB family regulatory protein